MTGFERPNRSYYLDCMNLAPNTSVVCKCNQGLYPFTAGKHYTVNVDGTLTDDNGVDVYPSARFVLA